MAVDGLFAEAKADGGFRLAGDQVIYAAVGPAVAEFYRAAKAPVGLAAGEADPMVGWPRWRRSIRRRRCCPASATTATSRRWSGPGACSNGHWKRRPSAVASPCAAGRFVRTIRHS